MYSVATQSTLFPHESGIFDSGIRWVDIGQGPGLLSHGRDYYSIQWLNPQYFVPSVLECLRKGEDFDGNRWIVKGQRRGAELLKKNLSGKKSFIILAMDLDILRDSIFHDELAIYFKMLNEEPWHYVIFTRTPYLENFAEILANLGGASMGKRVDLFFTGFNQPLETVLEQIFRSGFSLGNSQASYQDELSTEDHFDAALFYKVARAASVLARYEMLRVNFLIDSPLDDLKGGIFQKNFFSSQVTRSFLRANLGPEIDIFFADPYAMGKYPQLVSWLEKRGHTLSIMQF
jgi:hypothetical protein